MYVVSWPYSDPQRIALVTGVNHDKIFLRRAKIFDSSGPQGPRTAHRRYGRDPEGP